MWPLCSFQMPVDFLWTVKSRVGLCPEKRAWQITKILCSAKKKKNIMWAAPTGVLYWCSCQGLQIPLSKSRGKCCWHPLHTQIIFKMAFTQFFFYPKLSNFSDSEPMISPYHSNITKNSIIMASWRPPIAWLTPNTCLAFLEAVAAYVYLLHDQTIIYKHCLKLPCGFCLAVAKLCA